MKPKYQKEPSIKAPPWMNEAAQRHYQMGEHHRQKREQLNLMKKDITQNEKMYADFNRDSFY